MGEGRGALRRRDFLATALAGTAAAMSAVSDARGQARARPTPACGDSGGLTPPQTEGPYFKARSPLRASLLETGVSGTRLVIEGVVLTTACAPIAGAVVAFWQADDRGQYDNAGYRLRGHQLTDGAGRYRLETVVPGLYPGRTRHIHVTVAAPGRPALTTQLYFPGEAANRRDGIFESELIMTLRDGQGAKHGAFDFVLDVRPG
jgi:protocatechuate 3,4-dioxygenase beta subunit